MSAEQAERISRVSAMSRREHERISVRTSAMNVVWLSEGQTVASEATIADISIGGFCAWMPEAPVNGRIIRTEFQLGTLTGEQLPTIQAQARVCKRAMLEFTSQKPLGWIVNCAFESVHPTDEKMIAQAINLLKSIRSVEAAPNRFSVDTLTADAVNSNDTAIYPSKLN